MEIQCKVHNVSLRAYLDWYETCGSKISFHRNIAVLCVKISCVTWALNKPNLLDVTIGVPLPHQLKLVDIQGSFKIHFGYHLIDSFHFLHHKLMWQRDFHLSSKFKATNKSNIIS
jgi:hypothetical protein